MAEALIGYTGFIGSNLLAQRSWDRLYRKSNITTLEGEFELVVCCAAPAGKWLANQNPGEDRANIELLIRCLRRITAARFILISTVDVFAQPVDADEDTPPNPDCAYGRHRLELEEFVRHHFPGHTIVRLPGVIGKGLKKNAYYDLQHKHRLEHINPDSVFQWYPIDRLWEDIAGETHPLVHLCAPPMSVRELCEREFPDCLELLGDGPRASYNLRTKFEKP